MIELAIATSIPMDVWLEAGDRAIETALEVLDKQAKEIQRGR